MPFDPLLAASILISMNFSEKESLDLQYKTSDSHLHLYFILCQVATYDYGASTLLRYGC